MSVPISSTAGSTRRSTTPVFVTVAHPPPQKEQVYTKKKMDGTTPITTAELLTPASWCKAPQITTCLLKTAVAPVVAGNVKTQANILFDEGAQCSFISAFYSKVATDMQDTSMLTTFCQGAALKQTSSPTTPSLVILWAKPSLTLGHGQPTAITFKILQRETTSVTQIQPWDFWVCAGTQ